MMLADVFVLSPKKAWITEGDGVARELTAVEREAVLAPPVAELRPPAEHDRNSTQHWAEHPALISRDMFREVLTWVDGAWLIAGDDKSHTPADMAAAGWRYLGPAEWVDPARVTPLIENWPPLAMAERIVKDGDRIAALEAENARLRAHPPLAYLPSYGETYSWDADVGQWLVVGATVPPTAAAAEPTTDPLGPHLTALRGLP